MPSTRVVKCSRTEGSSRTQPKWRSCAYLASAAALDWLGSYRLRLLFTRPTQKAEVDLAQRIKPKTMRNASAGECVAF